MSHAIEIIDLKKEFGNILAVNGLSFNVSQGSLFGLLGPNGAGKTTTISIISTILPPTSGAVKIFGRDLRKETNKIKSMIGICPQELALFERLTARENIHLIAQMHGLSKIDYKEKTDDLLGKMNLLERCDDLVKKYSGGMKQRVNILMAIVHEPQLIILDEPSAGLDPQSRRAIWDLIKEYQKKGCTILLTTHSMEEADELSDQLAIIDHGKVIAKGTPKELKGRLGNGDIIEFKVKEEFVDRRHEIVEKLKTFDFVQWVKILGKSGIVLNAFNSSKRISELMDTIHSKVNDISIRNNSLEEVFLDLTGRRLRD